MSLSTSPNNHLGSRRPRQASKSALNGEINTDSIRALEEQIREHEWTIVKLKRARNSLLNVSKFPSEVLGEIFRWNVIPKHDFDELEEGSHNFLFVCHHWFQVASRTPELWSFWGNTLEDWTRRYPRSGSAPLDLVLSLPGHCYGNENIDAALCNELQGRATRNNIRRIHLSVGKLEVLNSIISSLTAKCEGTRPNHVESVILHNQTGKPVDVSDFFSHYRFPKLQYLYLSRCTISSLDHLTSRTGALTVLILSLDLPSPTPVASQLLSILASNPFLQKITLDSLGIPQDDSGPPSIRVPLHNLKNLRLSGDSRGVLRLLHRLDHPRRMDDISLHLDNCSAMEVSQSVGPYLRGYLRDRGRSQHGLGLLLCLDSYIIIRAGDVRGTNSLLQQMDTFLSISVELDGIYGDAIGRTALDLIAHVPGEEVVYFKPVGNSSTMENISTRFPNLRALTFDHASLHTMFPEPDLGRDKETLLSLQRVSFKRLIVDDGDWRPLVTFLARRESNGNRLDALEILDSRPMSREVVEVVKDMVGELLVDRQD